MKELNFDSGLVTYALNGKCEVSFNPTDSNFVERLYSAFEDLDKKQESYKAQIEKMADKKEIFEFARERDAEMRGIIDGVFEASVSEAVFGGMNVYAIANGLHLPKAQVISALQAAGLDERSRPEQLTLENYCALQTALTNT